MGGTWGGKGRAPNDLRGAGTGGWKARGPQGGGTPVNSLWKAPGPLMARASTECFPSAGCLLVKMSAYETYVRKQTDHFQDCTVRIVLVRPLRTPLLRIGFLHSR